MIQWLVLVTAMLVLGPVVSGRRHCQWMRWASPLAGVLVALAGTGEIALTVAGQLAGGALERGETLLISLWLLCVALAPPVCGRRGSQAIRR